MAQTTLDQRMLGVGTALTDHTITASDVITFADVGDSNLTKKDTLQGVLDLSSSDYVLLETETASGAAASDFTSLDNSTYSSYKFVVEFTPDTDGSHIDMLLAVSGTTYLEASNYEYIDVNATRASGSFAGNGNTGVGFFRFGTNTGLGNASDEGFCGTIECFYFGDTGRHAQIRASYSRMDNAGTTSVCWGATAGALIGSTSAITAVRFKANSGNHTGKIKMYGRK